MSLVAAISQLPGIDFYSVSPDWVEMTYPALAEAEGDRISVESVAVGRQQGGGHRLRHVDSAGLRRAQPAPARAPC